MPISIIEIDGTILAEVNNEILKLEDALGVIMDIAAYNCLSKQQVRAKTSKLYTEPTRSIPRNSSNSQPKKYEWYWSNGNSSSKKCSDSLN